MKAMLFTKVGTPLKLQEIEKPKIGAHQVLLLVHTCGVCRTDLHIIEGDLQAPSLPLILGHQIVGTIVEIGSAVEGYKLDQRVGVAWLHKSCGHCFYCKEERENLCDRPQFTGYHLNGGFAEFCAVEGEALYSIPSHYDDLHAAPLLCAGIIGYRAYKVVDKAKKIGFYGFGSSSHILTQLVTHLGAEVYAFTRDQDHQKQAFAKKTGAIWAGDSSKNPPNPLDAALIFAPSGELVVQALQAVRKGGSVVCAGIHMSDIPSFPYSLLWEERTLTSVANTTKLDGEEFMRLAERIPLHTHVTSYPLEKANEALQDLKKGKIMGSIVLSIKDKSYGI